MGERVRGGGRESKGGQWEGERGDSWREKGES